MAGETAVYAQDWSATTIRTIEQDSVWNRILPNFPVPMGYQQVHLPSASNLQVFDVSDIGTPGNDPHSADRSPTYAKQTLTLTVDKAATYDIPDNLRANTTFDTAALAGYESGQRMTDEIDSSLAGLFNSGLTSTSLDLRKGGTLGNPTGYQLRVAADNDGELVRDHFLQAEQRMLEQRVPSGTWFCIVPPHFKRWGLIDDDAYFTAANETSDRRIHGIPVNDARYVGMIFNFPVYVSTNNPSLHGTGTAGTKETVFWGSTLSAVKHVRAYPFEGLRDRIRIGDHYRQEFEWGLLVTRPHTVVRAVYDIATT